MHVHIHAGKEFWHISGQMVERGRSKFHNVEIQAENWIFLPRSASVFLIGMEEFWFFFVLSFKFSVECGISRTVPNSAVAMQPDLTQILVWP